MKIAYFNIHNGLIFSENAIAGEEAVKQNMAVAAEIPENISSWRLSYDIITRTVNVFGGVEKNEEQALKQQEDETLILAKKNKAADDQFAKNSELEELIKRAARRKLLDSKS